MNAKIALFLFYVMSFCLWAQPQGKAAAKPDCPEGLHPERRGGKKACVDYLGFEPEEFTLSLPKVSSVPSTGGKSPPPSNHPPKPRHFRWAYGFLVLVVPVGLILFKKISSDREFAHHCALIFAQQFNERRNSSSVYPNLYILTTFVSGYFHFQGVIEVRQNPGYPEVSFEEFEKIAASEVREILGQFHGTNPDLKWRVESTENTITVRIQRKGESNG